MPNHHCVRTPVRRLAAAAVTTSLAVAPVVLAGAGPAQAAGNAGNSGDKDAGGAHAVVLRTALDVSLLNKSVDLPLTLSLDEVSAGRAPGGSGGSAGEQQSAGKNALTGRLDGVDSDKPFSVLAADVATATVTADGDGARSSVRLAGVDVHLPGLPTASLLRVDAVTAKATCEAGAEPVATVNPLTSVTVFGQRENLRAGGPTIVPVQGIGEVRLDLSKKEITDRTAAATALRLTVSVNPLKLNVAEVTGTVTLAEVSCETPEGAHEKPAGAVASSPGRPAEETKSTEAAAEPGSALRPQAARSDRNLAESGGGSATPYLVGGAVVFLVVGAGGVLMARRRRG